MDTYGEELCDNLSVINKMLLERLQAQVEEVEVEEVEEEVEVEEELMNLCKEIFKKACPKRVVGKSPKRRKVNFKRNAS
jgi:hypothetical protein